MWAEMVHRAGVGPPPCPIDALTEDILVEKIQVLKSDEVRQRVQEVSEKMNREDGIQGGLEHFLSALPRDNMLCDVSLLLGEVKLARYRLGQYRSGIKLSVDVAAYIKGEETERGPFSLQRALVDRLERHSVTNYCANRITSVFQGLGSGIAGMIHNFIRSPFQWYYKPDHAARDHGCFGCIWGAILAPFAMILIWCLSAFVCVDRILTGISNSCCGTERLYTFDIGRKSSVRETQAVNRQFEAALAKTISDKRKGKLKGALKLAKGVHAIFSQARPNFPKEHWHFMVVEAEDLLASLTKHSSRLSLLSPDTRARIVDIVSGLESDTEVSFSRFCFFIFHASSASGSFRMSALALPDEADLGESSNKDPTYSEIFLAGAPSGAFSSMLSLNRSS